MLSIKAVEHRVRCHPVVIEKADRETTHDNSLRKMIQQEIRRAFRDFRGTSYNGNNYSERRQYLQFTRQTGQNRPSASFYRIGVLPTEYPFVIPVANGGILAAIIAGREIPEGTLDSPVIQGFNPLTGKTKCQCVQIRETRHRLWCREPAEANDIIIYSTITRMQILI